MAQQKPKLILSQSTIDILNNIKPAQSQPQNHLYKPLLNFDRSSISQYLNVSSSYISNILTGYSKPSNELHEKLMIIISEVSGDDVHLMQDGGLE